jgi:hypothetical protein
MPKSNRQASVAPPVAYQGTPGRFGRSRAAELAAVVKIVSVAVAGPVPVILTGLVEPKVKVGGYCAPAGLDVRAAVITTLPVKPPAGVTVIVTVFPVDAPRATVTVVPVPVMEMPGGIGVLIVTEKVTVAVFNAESVTLAAKLALPATGVAPDNTPALERLRPIAVRLLPPDVTVQV